jgi:hypothetical protein
MPKLNPGSMHSKKSPPAPYTNWKRKLVAADMVYQLVVSDNNLVLSTTTLVYTLAEFGHAAALLKMG